MSCMFLTHAHFSMLIDGLKLLASNPETSAAFAPLRDKLLGSASMLECMAFGQRLLDANYQSYITRYPDAINDFDIADLVYAHVKHELEDQSWGLPTYLKALHCYDYQCCESDDWPGHPVNVEFVTPALTAAVSYATKQGIGDLTKTAEYESAPWGIKEWSA